MVVLWATLASALQSSCVAEPTIPTAPSAKYQLRYVHTYITSGTRTPIARYLPVSHRGNWVCDLDDVYSRRISENGRRIRHRRDVSSLEYPASCSLGELTVDGMDQIQTLGSTFRKWLVTENNTFLANDYINPSELYVRAASKDRNYRTAISFLRGLYTPVMPDEEVNIFLSGPSKDILTPEPQLCLELSALKDSYLKTHFPAELERIKPILASVIDELHINSLDYDSLYSMCDFVIQMDCNDNYIANVTSEQVQECKKINGLLRTGIYTQNKGVAASYGLRELKRVLMEKNSGVTNSKMSIFAVDEDEIIALLVALGQQVDVIPLAASNLLMEVYMHGGEDYVRLSYNGKVLVIPELKEFEEFLYKMHDLMTVIEPMQELCKEMP